ncbi:hypothetical protein OH76DRAFT_1035119 [Lentinus brumalis]|uniref:Uncharacterized protein n=1 Tax=Lentinus brumalis TaxID=2498619 RepID=A0A371CX55_9APHY|nr:hypothetical protein OH76DRAFT_1035119 [Polyporus brumalis]
MQRRSSLSQLYQRVRRVSEPAIDFLSGGKTKKAPDESYFDYDERKDWQPKRRRPPDSSLRYRGLSQRHRKVSKEEIRYPLLHHLEDKPDPVENATTSDILPERPSRPSLDQRPPVVRDPQLRLEEQKVYRSMNSAKRPERPREQDLPYGAEGSIPRVLVKEERPPPPAAAVRGPIARKQYLARSNTVPFPSNHRVNTHGEDTVRARHANGATKAMGPHQPPAPAHAKVYTPFAPISPRDRPQYDATSSRNAGHADGPSHLAQASSSTQRLLDREHVPTPPPKDSKWLGPSAQTRSPVPSQMRRQDGVRKTSSSGDVHLPPQHARYQLRDENEALNSRTEEQELRTVRSTPLDAFKPNVRPVHPAAAPGLPAHPAVHLGRVGSRSKPRDPDVPRDVSPDNPQGLPTPRRSREGERPVIQRQRERAPQAIHPAHRPGPQPESDRQKRRREKEKAGRTVDWYGMGDSVSWEIVRALAEPEVVVPLPIDWSQFVANGKDYGTKPLELRKRKGQGPEAQADRYQN